MTEHSMAALADHPALQSVPTPGVVIDAAIVRKNIAAATHLVGGADRWRPHIKTCRSPRLLELLIEHGVTRFKAATLSELRALLTLQVPDVLVAYPAVGPRLKQIVQLADAYPDTRVSLLADDESLAAQTIPGTERLGLFIDVDPGWHRTGVGLDDHREPARLAAFFRDHHWHVRGLHCYDGHLSHCGAAERADAVAREVAAIDAAVGPLREIVDEPPEIILGGSHTVPDLARECASAGLVQGVTFGAGTWVINDLRSAQDLRPAGFGIAGAVLTRVVSVLDDHTVTVDAGISAVQLDAGSPHALVAGWPGLDVGKPSQEHLPVTVRSGPLPRLGQLLVLLPRHFDSSVIQFDRMTLIDGAAPPTADPLIGRWDEPW